MRSLSRLCFMAAAALIICVASVAHEVKAQTVGTGQVLISEFRLSGPGGDSDEYIEFYCNRETDCDISDYVIQAHDPGFGDFTVAFPTGTVIPARQYLLIGDSSGYSLPDYATLDFDVNDPMIPDFFIDNEGVQLRTPVAEEPEIIDSVGFIGGGNEESYIEGTGLQRATSARPADQYAYVRKRTLATDGLPQDTNNNADDFVLVSVTGTPHPGITAPPVLGAPGPQALTSPPSFSNAQVTGSLVEPAASKDDSPNRIRTGSGNSGTLSIRRSVTNNTADTFDYIAFRVIEIPTLNSPNTLGEQSQLRLVTSGDAETFMNSQGRTVVIRGTILEFDAGSDLEPEQPNGGGLNSTVHANLNDEFIAPGETVDVQFLFNVEQAGLYRFFVYVEAFPIPVEVCGPGAACAPSARNPSKPRASRRAIVMRHLVNLKRGTTAPVVVPILKKSKKYAPVAATAGTGATPRSTNVMPMRSTNAATPVRVFVRTTSARAKVRTTRAPASKARIVAMRKH